MTIYLTHETALQYWRFRQAKAKGRCRATLPFGHAREEACAKPFQEEIDELARRFQAVLQPPFHLCVPDARSRTHDSRVAFHVCSTELPAGSFVRIAPGVLAASVEWCYAQMSTALPRPAHLQLGFELCGRYRLRQGLAGKATDGPPLTSVHELESFVSALPSTKGAKAARRSIRHLCDGSKSPMETDVSIMLLLPMRMGGRGISKPLLNHRIDVPRSMRRILPQSYFELDLYWPDAAIALEYDSGEHHEGPAAAAHDAIRVNGIEQLGIRVVSMTKLQALDPIEFDRVATILAKQTGKRPCELSPELLAKRAELRDALFARFKQGCRPYERTLAPKPRRRAVECGRKHIE